MTSILSVRASCACSPKQPHSLSGAAGSKDEAHFRKVPGLVVVVLAVGR